jgi:hypothetical protein
MRLYLILFCSFYGVSRMDALSQMDPNVKTQSIAKTVIKEIVAKIKSSDEGQALLEGVDPNALTFGSNKHVPGATGWIVRWEIRRKVTLASPPQPAEAALWPIVNKDGGILLEIYVSMDHGDAREASTELFHLSEKPRIDIGYWLITFRKNPQLEKRIHRIIEMTKRDRPLI